MWLISALGAVAGANGGANGAAHAHNGILKQYEHVPPKRYGLSLRNVAKADLRTGRPVVRPMRNGRLMSVQDIHAPESTVWGAITDLKNYPTMVSSVARCDVYERRRTLSGGLHLKARYLVKIPPAFSLEYFCVHAFEPLRHCMTFRLDYQRKSQLSDMVGYWYVEELPDGWSRLFFSTDSTTCVNGLPTRAPCYCY